MFNAELQTSSSRMNPVQAITQSMRVPELRGKILFTLAMLVVYRLTAHIPIPGLDTQALDELFTNNELLGFMDLFSGGALSRMSIVALAVFPYITASIIMQMSTPMIPKLQAMSKEGEQGRIKINRITHWLALPIAVAQAIAQLSLLTQAGVLTNVGVTGDALLPTVAAVLSLTAGSMFLVWLGEQITERGIGNGISLIIFAGIVAGFPGLLSTGLLNADNAIGIVFFAFIGLAIIMLVVVFNEAHRRIPVQYGRSIFRGDGNQSAANQTYIPLRINAAGMIPLIFAFTLMVLFSTAPQYMINLGGWVGTMGEHMAVYFSPNHPIYWLLSFLMVVGFTFFYTKMIYMQQNIAENLQKSGGFVPGYRPGKPTEDHLNYVIVRLTMGGAIFLGFVAVVPFLATLVTDVESIALSGTSLLIMVGVGLDTLRQLEAQLTMRNYEGFLR